MAESKKDAAPKRRVIKKSETVREKAEKVEADAQKKQPRRLHATRRKAGAPFRVLGKGLRKLGKIKFFRIIGLVLVPPYFRNSWKEIRQVTWLKLPMAVRLTGAVIMFAIVFGLLVAGIDYVLDKIFKEVLLR